MNIKTITAAILKLTAIVLVTVVLFPSVVKLVHTFNHHSHEVCNESYSTHFHQVTIDCEFHKFKLSNTFYIASADYTIDTITVFSEVASNCYLFYKHKNQLVSYLRGPPVLV